MYQYFLNNMNKIVLVLRAAITPAIRFCVTAKISSLKIKILLKKWKTRAQTPGCEDLHFSGLCMSYDNGF